MGYKEFCDVYLPLSDRLYRVAYHLLESRDDAEDVLQDLYVKLWKDRDKLDTVYNPDGYCITLTMNLCIDRIRKATRFRSVPIEDDSDGENSTEIALVAKEQMLRVRQAIASLPESQRRVLELKFFDDMSYDEIAALTGKSPVHLRVLLNMARNKIKQSL